MARFCCYCKRRKEEHLMTRVTQNPQKLIEWGRILGADFLKTTTYFSHAYICRTHFPGGRLLSRNILPERSINDTNENEQMETERTSKWNQKNERMAPERTSKWNQKNEQMAPEEQANDTADSPSTSSAHEDDSNFETESDEESIPCDDVPDAQTMFTKCSNCKYSVKEPTTEMKFLNILSCGHVLCDLCLNMTSIHVIDNSFPYNTCPVCGTNESFMVNPTIHNNVAHCALHKDKQAKFYCKECMRFLCSEKECEKHPTINVKDIVTENARLGDDIDGFQSSLEELVQMEDEAKNSLSKFDQKSFEIRDAFQFIIDTATKRIYEVQKTFELERIVLVKKVDNISKNVAEVNRRIQTASKLDEIISERFPISEDFNEEPYKLAAGKILRNTLKISQNVKNSSKNMRKYQVSFEDDNRVQNIVSNLKVLFTKHTVSAETNSKDCERPKEINSTEQVPSTSNAKKLPPSSSPQTVTSDSEIQNRLQPFSRPSTSCPQKTQPHSEVKMKDPKPVFSIPNRKNERPEICRSLEPEKKRMMMMECAPNSIDHKVPSQMNLSNKVPLSKIRVFTPVPSRQTMTSSSERRAHSEVKDPKAVFITTNHRKAPNEIPDNDRSEKRIKIMKYSSSQMNPSYKVSLSKNTEILTPISQRQTMTANTEKPMWYPSRRLTCSQMNSSDGVPLPRTIRQTLTSNSEIPNDRPSSTSCPQKTQPQSQVKIMDRELGFIPPHRRKAPREIPEKYRFLDPKKRIKLVKSPTLMSSPDDCSSSMNLLMDTTCKQESQNLDEEVKVEKIGGEAGTSAMQMIHINCLIGDFNSEQNHGELQDVKQEEIKIEPAEILDKEIKQEEPV